MRIRAKLIHGYATQDSICVELRMMGRDFALTASLTDYVLSKEDYYSKDEYRMTALFIFFWRDILIQYFNAKIIDNYDEIYDMYPIITCGDAIEHEEIIELMNKFKIKERDIKKTVQKTYISTQTHKVNKDIYRESEDLPF